MGRGEISVETSALDATSKKVTEQAELYKAQYLALFSTVQEMKTTWAGKDSDAFSAQIEGYRNDFQLMENLLNQYATFLKETADRYRQTQESIVSATKTLNQGH